MSDDYKIVAADLTLHAAMTHEQYRNQTIRELIEKAEAESYTACMAVPDEEPDQAHIAATWLKSQIEGSR